MKVFEKVYCIGCGSIMHSSSAEQVFKTGFYQTTIPLASCKACAEKKVGKQEMNELINVERNCYADYLEELPMLA